MAVVVTSVYSFIHEAWASASCHFGVVAQELLVMSVFFLSFVMWRVLGQHTKKVRAARKLDSLHTEAPLRRSTTPPSPSSRRSPEHHALGQHHAWPPAANNKSSPASQASVLSAEKQMLQALERREFTRALNMYRTLEKDGRERVFSEDFYKAFIHSAVRVGKLDVVELFLRAIRRNGSAPSAEFSRGLLRLLSSRKHFGTCLFLHTLFGRNLPTDKVVYSCLINAALEVGEVQTAALMLPQYAQADLDAKDYILFFRTYVATQDVDAAEELFWKLGSKVTTLMLNHLLLTCANVGQPDRGLKIVHKCRDMKKTGVVDVVSYNTLLKGFAQFGKAAQCFECLREMTSQGIKPDEVTFATALDACLDSDNTGAISEIVSVFTESNESISTVMYTLFIKGLVKANCVTKALELCEEMRRRGGPGPDVITYSILIKALVDQHDFESALKLVEEMKAAGFKPDDIIFTHLLEGCRIVGDYDMGKKLFAEMLASGVRPSEFTLVTMLKLHGRFGAHQEAHNLVAGWQAAHGTRPSVIHFTCLMSGCLRTKTYGLAWDAYELMCKSGVQPDKTTMATLLPGMVAAQQWERVMTLARQALSGSHRCAVPTETLNNALAQMQAAGGHDQEATQLRELLLAAGVPVTSRCAATKAKPWS